MEIVYFPQLSQNNQPRSPPAALAATWPEVRDVGTTSAHYIYPGPTQLIVSSGFYTVDGGAGACPPVHQATTPLRLVSFTHYSSWFQRSHRTSSPAPPRLPSSAALLRAQRPTYLVGRRPPLKRLLWQFPRLPSPSLIPCCLNKPSNTTCLLSPPSLSQGRLQRAPVPPQRVEHW